MVISLILISALNIILINGQCKWSNPSLDLSCLAGQTIKWEGRLDGNEYTYTVCADSSGCSDSSKDGNSGSAMAWQDAGDFCWILGRYSASIPPVNTNASSPGQFEFTYDTGTYDAGCNNENNNTRTWKPTFICKPGVEFDAGEVSEEGNQCIYDAIIYTKYACIDSQVSCSDDSSGLSGGWIFIIILICGLFAYFCVGYIVMALTVNKQGGFADFSNNIPNKAIWVNCIPLVVAGCVVTKDFMVGLTNRGGSDKEDTLVEDSAGNEETS